MNVKKLLIATVAVGVVMNVFDFVVHGMILHNAVYANLTTLLNQNAPMHWLIIGEFFAGLVFVFVYDRVYGSFGGGIKGGMRYGLLAGILVNFPAQIYNHLLINGFTYGLAWTWIIVGVLWGVVAGAVAGALYKREAAPAMA
jgi:hypothetical protein